MIDQGRFDDNHQIQPRLTAPNPLIFGLKIIEYLERDQIPTFWALL